MGFRLCDKNGYLLTEDEEKEYWNKVSQNHKLRELIEKRIEEVKDYDPKLVNKDGITKNSAKCVTYCEFEKLLEESKS